MDSLIDNALLIFAVLFVLSVAGIGGFIAKQHFSGEGISLFNSKQRRLGFVEQASIGGHRKLVLVRRDNVEHLILTGGPVDLVLETGIQYAPNGHLREAPVLNSALHDDGIRDNLFSRFRNASFMDDKAGDPADRAGPPELTAAPPAEKAN